MRTIYIFSIFVLFLHSHQALAQGYLRVHFPLETDEVLVHARVAGIGELGPHADWYKLRSVYPVLQDYFEKESRWVQREFRIRVVPPEDGSPGFALEKTYSGRMIPTEGALQATRILGLLREDLQRVEEYQRTTKPIDTSVQFFGNQIQVDVEAAEARAGIKFLKTLLGFQLAKEVPEFADVARFFENYSTLTLDIKTNQRSYVIEVPAELLNPERGVLAQIAREKWGLEWSRKAQVTLWEYRLGRSGIYFPQDAIKKQTRARFSLLKPELDRSCAGLF